MKQPIGLQEPCNDLQQHPLVPELARYNAMIMQHGNDGMATHAHCALHRHCFDAPKEQTMTSNLQLWDPCNVLAVTQSLVCLCVCCKTADGSHA